MAVGVGAARGPTGIPQQSHVPPPHTALGTWGVLSTEFNTTTVPGMGEPDPGETLLRQPVKSGRYIAGSLVPLLWETRPEHCNGACWLENL